MTLAIILVVWLIGYVLSFYMLKKNDACDGKIFDIAWISTASWLVFMLYLIWWLHNRL